jgi:hypothetical protein
VRGGREGGRPRTPVAFLPLPMRALGAGALTGSTHRVERRRARQKTAARHWPARRRATPPPLSDPPLPCPSYLALPAHGGERWTGRAP